MRTLSFLLSAVLVVLALGGSVSRATPAPTTTGLLQFTAQQHVLGFRAHDWFVSNGTYSLRVRPVNANVVTPTSADPAALDGRAAPLTRVTYANVWDGIDMTLRASAEGIVESVYAIAPHADVNAIQLEYNAPVTLNADGTLTTHFETGNVTESAPIAWQEINGARVPVPAQFEIQASGVTPQVAFAVGAYDRRAPLYIDPTLTWHTFLGGASQDLGNGIAVDASGDVYIVGTSNATWGSPTRAYSASGDAFVAKLHSSGGLLWNTFLGGSGYDYGRGIALSESGSVYVIGGSNATWGNPVRAYSAGSDAFVAKLSYSTGALVWNTFLGGSTTDGGNGIAVDGNGYIYVAGTSGATWGSPVRAYTAGYDAFAARLNPAGVLAWNTFLGGNGDDGGTGIISDAGGNVYVSGSSNANWGNPIRAYTSNQDAFVVKLDSNGALGWNTFLGGSSFDNGYGITTDASGNIYVVGSSHATWGNPVRAYTADDDVFAARLNPNGTLVWNTFLGGSGSDDGNGIAVHGSGNIFVAGASAATWGNPVRPYTAGADAFAAKLKPNGALEWNTFLGGTGNDSANGIAVHGSGNMFVVGVSTATWGNPVRAFAAGYDAFVANLYDMNISADVTGFKASINPQGKVVLKWQTTTELHVDNFKIFRKKGKAAWEQVNGNLILAKKAGTATGAKYKFTDKSVMSGKKYRYQIQVVYDDQHVEWSKPVKIKTP